MNDDPVKIFLSTLGFILALFIFSLISVYAFNFAVQSNWLQKDTGFFMLLGSLFLASLVLGEIL